MRKLVVDKVAWIFLGYLFYVKIIFYNILKIVRSHVAKFCYICIKQQTTR